MTHDYHVNCPFCGHEQTMMPSEYPYTTTNCTECMARYECDNRSKTVRCITRIPDDIPDDRIAEVLQAGIHGDGPGVSSRKIDASEVESYGVEVP